MLIVPQSRTYQRRRQALDELESTGKITHREWGRRVATEIIPDWEAAEDRVSVVQLPAGSPLLPLRAALIHYLDQKRFALDVLSDAARNNDHDKLEWGRQVSRKNEARAEEIRALVRQVY